jgi:tetratricopeptide (TPR) repeat protein
MSDRLRLYLLSAVLVLATVASYWPTFHAGFIDFDDAEYVYENPHVTTGLSAANVGWAFTHSHSANWHPITWISHMVDIELFGLEPGGHHAANVALHAVNVLLLFLLLRSLTGQTLPSFVVAGLFAVHPTHVESVAWVSQRKTTLSTLFAILAIWGYARSVRLADRWSYAGSLACFSLSLMSKQTFVTLPFLLLLLDYWPLCRRELEPPGGRLATLRSLVTGWARLSVEKLPYLLLAMLASAATLIAQRNAMQSLEVYPAHLRLGNVILSYAGYLGLFVWPSKLSVFYPQYVDDITLARVLASLALLLVTTSGAIWLGLRRRHLLFGWLWFLVALVPMIGLVQVGVQSMADRYTYVPFWGLLIALTWSVRDGLQSLPRTLPVRTAAGIATAALLVGWGWLSLERARKWHDTITLFEDAAVNVDRNWLAHRSLAAHYFSVGDFESSLRHCKAGMKLGRDLGTFLATCGLTLHALGSKDLALEQLQESTRIAPEKPMGFLNLGWAYSEAGRYDLAAEQFAAAADRLPPWTSAYSYRMVFVNWGKALWHLGRPRDAIAKYDLALERDPDTAFVLRDAGAIDLQLGNVARAVARLGRAAALDPADSTTAQLLADARRRQAELDAVADELSRRLRAEDRPKTP